jgi:hypothetical protein
MSLFLEVSTIAEFLGLLYAIARLNAFHRRRGPNDPVGDAVLNYEFGEPRTC